MQVLKQLSRVLGDFVQERRGNVAILFGFALIPLLLATGVAVDYGRAMMVRDRMADAADSAALAIGSWPDLTQAQMTTKAQQYFDANYPPSTLGTVGKLNVSFSGDDITVTVSGTVKTTFMGVANIDHIDVGATSTVTKKQRKIELVLVLDTTGSMGQGGKIDALKSAAKKMVSTLFNGNATSDSLKIGVVPFAAAVNIGTDKLNSGWLDKTAATSISYEDFKAGVKVLDLYATITNRDWPGCVRERGGAYELTDDPPASGSTLWGPYFACPDEAPITQLEPSQRLPLSDGSYTGATCAIGSTDSDKRQCYTGKYTGKSVSSTSMGPDFSCPPAKITAMTNTASTVNTAIDALQAKDSTVIPTGLLWGWRAISHAPLYRKAWTIRTRLGSKAIVLHAD